MQYNNKTSNFDLEYNLFCVTVHYYRRYYWWLGVLRPVKPLRLYHRAIANSKQAMHSFAPFNRRLGGEEGRGTLSQT